MRWRSLLTGIILAAIFSGFDIHLFAIEKNLSFNKRIEYNFERQNFDSCIYYYYLLSYKYRSENDSASIVKTWFNVSWLQILRGDISRARASKAIAEKYTPKNNVFEYYIYNQLYFGFFYYQKEDFKVALGFLKEVVNKPFMHENIRLQTLIKFYIAECYFRIGGASKGESEINKVFNEKHIELDSLWFGYAYGLYLKGIYYYQQKNLKCIEILARSVRIYESLNIYDLHWIRSYEFLFVATYNVGKQELAKAYYQKLTTIFENYRIDNKLFYYYYTLKGLFFEGRYEYQEALDAYLKAYEECKYHTEKKKDVAGHVFETYFYLGKYQKNLEWYVNLDSKNKYFKVLLAYSCLKLGDRKKSEGIIRNVNVSTRSLDPDYSKIVYWLPRYYYMIGDVNKAEYFFRLELVKDLRIYGKVHQNTSFAYNSLGYFYYNAKRDYIKSLHYFHHTVWALIRDEEKSYYQLPDIENSVKDDDLSMALANKAQAFYQISKQRKNKLKELKDLNACLANLELSAQVMHRYKMSLQRENQKLGYADLNKFHYPDIIMLCLELYNKTKENSYANKAFEYAEKSKSSLLLSMVRGVNAGKMHLVPDNIQQLEEQLRLKAEMQSQVISEEYGKSQPNRAKIDSLNTALYSLKLRQDCLMNVFKQEYPAYYNAKFNSDVIGVGALQKKLLSDEVLLQYSLSNDIMVTFLVTRSQYKIFTDTIKPSFFNDVESYRKRISFFSFSDMKDTSIQSFAKVSNRLYQHLVQPLEPYLAGKKLLIIPDDVLNQIPFESLVTQVPQRNVKSYKDLPYLISDHVISYSFSATLHAMDSKAKIYPHVSLLAVAPGYDHVKVNGTFEKDIAAIRGDTLDISPIPGTYDEAKDIQKIFGGDVLLKKHATERRFAEMCGQYDILHLAMHGMINNDYPMFSRLIFTAGKDSADDGFLNTYEIYNMKINSPLVVLSACNTGSGKFHKGEGIISLARGFFTAGARSIVMTLWSVADKTSSKLINFFYKELASKKCISDAMRMAKLDYLKQSDGITSHPYFWAGYIAIGNSSVSFEPAKRSSASYIVMGLLALVLLLSGGLTWKKFRTRQ
jgi:CHAT domain-containing protein